MEIARRPRDPQRGNSLVLSLIVLTALGTLSALTVFSVRGGIQTSANDRFHSIAQYAAESGAAVAMDTLRKNINFSGGFGTFPSRFVSPNNGAPVTPTEIPGNQKQPGAAGNLFQSNAWYEVTLYNNRSDPGYATGTDQDGDLIIRSTGHGPDGATAMVEYEINGNKSTTSSGPCPSYAQKDLAENGTGANDCLSAISATSTATYRPGGP